MVTQLCAAFYPYLHGPHPSRFLVLDLLNGDCDAGFHSPGGRVRDGDTLGLAGSRNRRRGLRHGRDARYAELLRGVPPLGRPSGHLPPHLSPALAQGAPEVRLALKNAPFPLLNYCSWRSGERENAFREQ